MNDLLGNGPIRYLIPGILLTGLLTLSFMVLREFSLALVWAIIIVYVMWPPYQWLRRQFKDQASLSAAVMTAIIAAVISLIVYWLAAMLQEETKIAYQSLVGDFTQGPYRLPGFISRIPWLGNYLQEWIDRICSVSWRYRSQRYEVGRYSGHSVFLFS
jgi:Ca2+-transporting ATPase